MKNLTNLNPAELYALKARIEEKIEEQKPGFLKGNNTSLSLNEREQLYDEYKNSILHSYLRIVTNRLDEIIMTTIDYDN